MSCIAASASQGDAGCKDHSDQAGAGVRATRVSCVSTFAKGITKEEEATDLLVRKRFLYN